jgi:ketosteroid isomerase-like protein
MTQEEELKVLSVNWDKAMVGNNADDIGSYMSDDWVIVGTGGGITSRQSFLDEIISGRLFHTRMDSDEMRVKIYGNSGVVVSKGTSAGTYRGESFSLYVFIRENEKWLCVLTMLTPANNPL